MVKITNYTKAELVEIQYPHDPTCYIYEKDSKILTQRLLRIIETKQKSQVFTKMYKD